MSALEVLAPAKVNLALRILGRRQDGYHELDTLFQAVSLWDVIHLSRRPEGGVALEVVGADVGPSEDNLALRAARAWAEASGVDPAVSIRLEKRIPAGAGLGGGSSDAGAVLRGLEVMHGGLLGGERLRRVASGLGADVAFFAGSAGLARGEGIGDRLTPLPALEARELVVAVPGTPVPTGPAYGWLAASRGGGGASEPLPALDTVDWGALDGLAGNDFHDVVAARIPEVATLALEMVEAGLEGVLLSGSGSALFGFPGTGASAEEVAARLSGTRPGVRAWAARTLAALPEPRG